MLTHTRHYSMGVVKGIRAYKTARDTAICRLGEHIGRLFRSARILGIPMPYDHATLTEVCRRVVRDNDCLYPAPGLLRLHLTAGPRKRWSS